MKWDDPSIAGFVYHAGFKGGEEALAVAVALGTSQGDDAYEYSPLFGPRHHWVGLFGIDVAEFPQFDISLMRNPIYNAQAAYLIWAATGTSWEWSQPYLAGAHRHYAARAAYAVTQPSATQYGFALGGDDLDSSGLARMASQGNTSVANLAAVVGRL